MITPLVTAWLANVKLYNEELDRSCKKNLGVGVGMFKITKNIVHLGSLVLAGYAINNGADPMTALVFAAVIISGPEVLEWWLVNNPGKMQQQEQSDSSDK